ncbi:MAG: PQQ-binding-like beta-propeller repeat protein [Anaerolineaceae bacterium]|nr:PQQ-binding-like beta-propeller repeat protein [Anaerolineaceae bacterium]
MSTSVEIRRVRRKFSFRGCLLALFGLVISGLVIWGLFTYTDNVTPQITSIPLLKPGQTTLQILGNHFGSQPDKVWFSNDAGTTRQAADVISWQDNQISVHLPPGVLTGSFKVEQHTPIGSRSSDFHEFIILRPPSDQPQSVQAPTQPGSPWPTFRRDAQNTAWSPTMAAYNGGQPWYFKTERGIFSTPVIDASGNIYFGSADHYFYALNPDGNLEWKYQTGEIIDSAGALFDASAGSKEAPLVFISGDGNMYGFKLDNGISNSADRLIWKYQAQLRPGISFNRWFEGNVAVGPDGTLYAGNTNFNYYAITPTGQLKWTYPTDSNNWSLAAFGNDGTIYWGSNDTFIRAVSPSGKELWRLRTLGFIAASAAVGSDNTVYIGSFDSNLYAVDPATGNVRWKFPTLDHIYSSAALGRDNQGNTNAIYFGSADGTLYAVKADGSLIWRYDTGDPIRSSPVIGLAPNPGGTGIQKTSEVVYFGCGNGKLYALNAADGSLRWSYDTTPADPELQDRNDLNGSPALGQNGIYIGGESGSLVYVPYDYCLHSSDPRCATSNSDLPGRLSQKSGGKDQVGLYYVTPGGSTQAEFPATLSSAAIITLRLVDVKDGHIQNAYVCNNPLGCPASDLQIDFNPPLPFSADHSADGRYIYIRPQGFMAAGTSYTVTVKGRYYSGGFRLGNVTLFGSPQGAFGNTFQFKTDSSAVTQPPVKVGLDQTSALEWTRLAAPLPPMLPSLNQIGFDYMDWVVGTVVITPPNHQKQGKVILWAVGAKRSSDGVLVADPASDTILPLSGSYQNDSLLLSNKNFKMAITGINIPFNLFEMRGQLGRDGIMRPGATVFADTQALSIPKFGPYLVIAGLANNIYQQLLVAGTYITRSYPAAGPANKAPAGVQVGDIQYQAPDSSKDGSITAHFNLAQGSTYLLKDHKPAILLVDTASTEAVFMDYQALLSAQADQSGNLSQVTLNLPAGTALPKNFQAYVILDVFPLADKQFGN